MGIVQLKEQDTVPKGSYQFTRLHKCSSARHSRGKHSGSKNVQPFHLKDTIISTTFGLLGTLFINVPKILLVLLVCYII
jgi:hypothetical protein